MFVDCNICLESMQISWKFGGLKMSRCLETALYVTLSIWSLLSVKVKSLYYNQACGKDL